MVTILYVEGVAEPVQRILKHHDIASPLRQTVYSRTQYTLFQYRGVFMVSNLRRRFYRLRFDRVTAYTTLSLHAICVPPCCYTCRNLICCYNNLDMFETFCTSLCSSFASSNQVKTTFQLTILDCAHLPAVPIVTAVQ